MEDQHAAMEEVSAMLAKVQRKDALVPTVLDQARVVVDIALLLEAQTAFIARISEALGVPGAWRSSDGQEVILGACVAGTREQRPESAARFLARAFLDHARTYEAHREAQEAGTRLQLERQALCQRLREVEFARDLAIQDLLATKDELAAVTEEVLGSSTPRRNDKGRARKGDRVVNLQTGEQGVVQATTAAGTVFTGIEWWHDFVVVAMESVPPAKTPSPEGAEV